MFGADATMNLDVKIFAHVKDKLVYLISEDKTKLLQPRKISSLNMNDVCKFSNSSTFRRHYLFFTTGGADSDCQAENDNEFIMIHSDMAANDIPIAAKDGVFASLEDESRQVTGWLVLENGGLCMV